MAAENGNFDTQSLDSMQQKSTQFLNESLCTKYKATSVLSHFKHRFPATSSKLCRI